MFLIIILLGVSIALTHTEVLKLDLKVNKVISTECKYSKSYKRKEPVRRQRRGSSLGTQTIVWTVLGHVSQGTNSRTTKSTYALLSTLSVRELVMTGCGARLYTNNLKETSNGRF